MYVSEYRNEKVLGRWWLVNNNETVVDSDDDRMEAIKKGKQMGGYPAIKLVDSQKVAGVVV